jgi:hypothetical protein
MGTTAQRQDRVEQETYGLCKHLYSDKVKWETSSGWDEVIRKFSIKCEELNLRFYGKYRLKIIAEQIKQKWGELRIYCSIKLDPHPFTRFLRRVIGRMTNRLNRVDYKYKTVVDSYSHKKHLISVFDSKDSRDKLGRILDPNSGNFEWCGKFIRTTDYDVFGTHHLEPTRHRLLKKIFAGLVKFNMRLGNEPSKISKDTELIREYMDMMLDTYTTEAENEAVHTCEECGRKLIVESDRCWTKGWVRCLCKSCAIAGKGRYYCDGELYEKGVLIEGKKSED